MRVSVAPLASLAFDVVDVLRLGHSNRCVKASFSLMTCDMEHLPWKMLIFHLLIFFGVVSVKAFGPLFYLGCLCIWASLVAQRLKRLPAMWETWVQSLGREDPLEKEMATHSSILAWRILWMEEPDGLQFMGSQRVGHD